MPNTPTAKTTSTGGTEYRYMGTHATEVQIGDTLPWLEPGEIIELDSAATSNEKIKDMIESGVLVETSTIGAEAELQAMTAEAQATDAEAKGGK